MAKQKFHQHGSKGGAQDRSSEYSINVNVGLNFKYLLDQYAGLRIGAWRPVVLQRLVEAMILPCGIIQTLYGELLPLSGPSTTLASVLW